MSVDRERIITKRLVMTRGKPDDACDLADFLRRNRARLEPLRPDWPLGFDSENTCRARLLREGREWDAGQSKYLYLRLGGERASTVIGTCSLFSIDEKVSAELGFQIDKDFEGLGLAREAAEAVMTHGFHDIGVEKIIAVSLENNHRSLSLIKGLGFEFHGKMNDLLMIDGQKFDHHQFEVTRNRFMSLTALTNCLDTLRTRTQFLCVVSNARKPVCRTSSHLLCFVPSREFDFSVLALSTQSGNAVG